MLEFILSTDTVGFFKIIQEEITFLTNFENCCCYEFENSLRIDFAFCCAEFLQSKQ